MDVTCPHCRAMYEVAQSEYGNNVRCEICGKAFVIETPPVLQAASASCGTAQSTRYWSILGRANRSEYLKILLKVGVPTMVLLTTIMIIVGVIINPWDIVVYFMLSWTLAATAFCVVSAPVSIRRLHDMNSSGICYALIAAFFIIPFVGLIIGGVAFLLLACPKGTSGDNDYGSSIRVQKKANRGVDCRRMFQDMVHYIGICSSRLLSIRFPVKKVKMGILITAILCLIIRGLICVFSGNDSHAKEDGPTQSSIPSFIGVRNLEDVFKEGVMPDEDYLYEYSGHGDLKIQQVIFHPPGVLVREKGVFKSVFIKMDDVHNLVNDDPLPPITVRYTGVFRYETVMRVTNSVRAFKVASEYKITSD